jgi:hypothetical protein
MKGRDEDMGWPLGWLLAYPSKGSLGFSTMAWHGLLVAQQLKEKVTGREGKAAVQQQGLQENPAKGNP